MANTIPLNSTALEDREYSQDEVDALAAAELPVQDAPIPPNASTASAAASGAPEPTGSAGLITGEGALPARGPAIGPVAQLEDREYTAEEIDLLERANRPKGYTQDEVDKMVMEALEDPNYIPTRDEYFDQKATKQRLKAQGKIPGNGELAAKAVGGLFVTAADVFYTLAVDPEGSVTRIPETWDRIKADTLKEPKSEALAKAPATLQTGIGRAALSAMQLGGWAKQALEGQPKYINEATGEFLFAEAQNPMILAGFQERYPNQPIRPTNEEDLKDYEFKNHLWEKGIDAQYQELGQKTAPTELLTRVLTGRNQQETPIESQAQVLEIATDPTNIIPFSAGAKPLGLSRGMKIVSSKTASGIEKLAGGLVKGNDALAERFARVVTEKTGVSPQNISAAANAMTFGRNVGIGGGIAAGASALGAPPEVTATIAGFYPVYKAGVGVLRKIETGAGTAKIILRESADATNGLDQAARAAVLANPAVPSIFKEVLERPSQFVSIESTPARLAANQALSPQMRAFMGKLSNPAIVQAVRGSSALATGAAKGAAANVPFALLAANAGQDEDAAAMLAMGGTFGALGGGVDRFTGLQQRRQQAALSDVSRMLVDIELNAGDVGKMMATQTPDNLVRLAAMQGTFRNGLDFVPLSAEDYDANVAAQGGAGTAGMFVQAPLGERAKVFINLDARRGGVEPHEFGHALLASGALDGQQKYAARAWVDKTYGPEGVQARAREYASNIIRGKNASAFPDGNFEISPGTLTAEMDNLSQGGLARGDMDGLDWARDEIFAETFAKASNTMDFAAIRRGAPAGGNMLTFAESVLGAQARALSASGVRIDPQTGQALDTPGSLFKENPILATDKALLNQLGTYINNYRQWANDPSHEKPRPNRIAPSGRASDIANNPQVTFYDRGDGVKATTFATQDPATGQAILRDQRDLNKEHAKVKEQIRNIVGSKLIPDSNPVLGPKKTADGRVTVRGRVLPPSFDFLNGFMPHIRAFARQFEALGAAGESMQVRYHAIGSGDTGAFRVNRLGNLEAITREVIPWGWELTKAGNLNATVLDLSQFRNRAMRGIAERNPALAPFDWDMGKIEADLKTYMENHRQELPGSTKIGEEKRDAINAILGIATTKNRERNALSGSFGPGSAIKQFRLDRVDAAVGTGRTGFHFDYDRANRNFMPDKPAPMPDLSRDLPMPKIPFKAEIPSIKVRFGNTGQNYSLIPPGQALPEAYHGTPHKVDRFSTEKIGTGEGAQAYGWGLYFAQAKAVGEGYRDQLGGIRLMTADGQMADNIVSTPGAKKILKEARAFWKQTKSLDGFVKELESAKIQSKVWAAQGANVESNSQYVKDIDEVLSVIKDATPTQTGNLYTVELDVDDADLLDWDKPLSEQSPKVQAAIKSATADIWKSDKSEYAGSVVYNGLVEDLRNFDKNTAEKMASERLLAAGIPGIRYLDGGSRSKKDGTYNYVVFDENLIKIKAENGQPVSTQEFAQAPGQAMPDAVAGRAKDMPMSALKVLHADSSTLPKPDKKTTNAKVALQLADAAEKHYGGKVTSSNITPEIESDLIIVGSDEAEAALKASGKNAANWYSTAIQAALAVAGTIHRSLSDLNVAKQNKFFAKESDPVKAAQFALRIPLAITSQNMTVPLNARYANEQFDIFSKTGKFDPSKSYGEKAKSISGNLQLANDMIDAFGGITALEAFVSKEFTVRDLEAVASKAAGRKVTIAGRKEDMVNGAAIFGPKIGQGFLQNLMGNFDPVTIDLWMRRTWGRWTGDVVGDGVTATRLGRIIQEYRNSGRKLPDLIKRLRTVERSTGVTSTGKPKKPELTVSEDVEARIDNDPAFRKEIEAFAKEANAEFQGYYKLISQPMSLDEVKRINKAFQDAQANQDKADSIIQNAFTTTVRRQQAIKTMLDQKWDGMSPEQKKKLNEQNPQKAIAKDAWVAMQHAAQKRTEVLPNEIKNALKPNWANAAKSIVSELNPIDIPSDLDRRVISRVVNGIREEMGRRGYSLTNADVQAILWYPEKDLWAKLRGEQESGLKQSYDDEFIKIAEDLGLGSEAREVANRIRGY